MSEQESHAEQETAFEHAADRPKPGGKSRRPTPEPEIAGEDELRAAVRRRRPASEVKPDLEMTPPWYERAAKWALYGNDTLNYQKRRMFQRPKRPDHGFWEIFGRKKDRHGNPLSTSIMDRLSRGWNMGRYHADRSMDAMGDLLEKLAHRRDVEVSGFETLAGKGIGKEYFSEGIQDQMRRDEEGRAERMADTAPDFSDQPRAWITPGQDRGIGSNKVGPERQIRVDDGPWPLDKPAARQAGEGAEGPGKTPPRDSGEPRAVKGPPRHPALPAPGAGEKRGAAGAPPVSGPSSQGEAASEKGRARARERMKKGQVRKAGRKAGRDAEMEA